MIIYLNPAVNNHTGRQKLNRIFDVLSDKAKALGSHIVVEEIPLNPLSSIYRHIENGEKVFIAGGGDGTVHSLANAMMELPGDVRKEVCFGAVGLGSSNDFHKPLTASKIIRGIPIRIDFTDPEEHNVAHASYVTDTDRSLSEYFVINGSMGATAEINHVFNNCKGISGWLKAKWTDGCIYYCGLKVFANYRNIAATIEIDKEEHPTKISNLGFLIYPNFAGDFKYDIDVSPQSGYFSVALSEKMNKVEQFTSTISLLGHKFRDRPKTRWWNTQDVGVKADNAVAFEMDGEVRMVTKVNINLIKGGLMVCR
jgi:diacylglycerol kinase family enzyme